MSHSSNPRVYERSMILRRDLDLNLTKKRGSTTAAQALTEKNVHRRIRYWTMPHPVGIHGTPRHELIDVDECGIWLGKANRTSGKAFKGCRVREPGPYGHGDKWTLVMAIDTTSVVHFTFSKVAGTTLERYNAFLDDTIALKLPSTLPPVSGPCRTFIHDNLSAHLHPQCFNTITLGGHRVVARTPYSPMDGPIEYAFNQVGNELNKRLYSIKTEVDLVREVQNILSNLGPFDTLFQHCGYL